MKKNNIVVLRYLNDTQGEPRYVEYYNGEREVILKYETFISRYGDSFTDIPTSTIMNNKEKDDSIGK